VKIGYARVSTGEQNPDLQLRVLKEGRVRKRLRGPRFSGAATIRPGLEQGLKLLWFGDVPVVWKLDRLGRSLPHLIRLRPAVKTSGDVAPWRHRDKRPLDQVVDRLTRQPRNILRQIALTHPGADRTFFRGTSIM
jgi:hypothetical protein